MIGNKYATLIDEQTHAFINRTDAAFPADAETLPIAEQRALYDKMCELFRVAYPQDASSSDSVVNTTDHRQVRIRQYVHHTDETAITDVAKASGSATSVQLIYLHGGGFVLGGLDSHDDVCAEICSRTGYPVTSVDYRLSPEHKHPDALNDVMQVVDHLWNAHAQPVVLCGDSAGANLAAASCHMYRNRRRILDVSDTAAVPLISGQVLIYAGLGGDMSRGSYITHAHAPMLSTEAVRYFTDIRRADRQHDDDPSFAPLLDKDFAALPPTVTISAQCDPLSDDGRVYCEQIIRAGGKAHWINEPGLVHGFLRARHCVKRAENSFDRIVDAIAALAANRWPY